MICDIYFCTDGVLRAKHGKNPSVPVSFLQENSKKEDFHFWARMWDNNVYFEEGLTLGMFLQALEPWQDFFGILVGNDIAAFIKESKKPSLVETNSVVSYIQLSYNTHIELESKFKSIDIENLNLWLNSPKEEKLSGKWKIFSSYDVTGYVENEIEKYSMSYSSMNKLVNIPLFLSDSHYVFIDEFRAKRHGLEEKQLFSTNLFGVRQAGSIESQRGTVHYLLGKKYHAFIDVLRGFWDDFEYSPHTREDLNSVICSRLEEVHASLSQENVIDTEKTELSSYGNVMSPKIENLGRKLDFWEEVIEKAAETSTILRIGQIKAGKPPETRVSAFIEQEQDLSTEFKKV